MLTNVPNRITEAHFIQIFASKYQMNHLQYVVSNSFKKMVRKQPSTSHLITVL